MPAADSAAIALVEVLRERADDDDCSVAAERTGSTETDPPAAAGDQRDAPVQRFRGCHH